MKKEQTLLVVAAALAGLVLWQSLDLYASVGASQVPDGDDVEVTETLRADPLAGVDPNPPIGRSFLRQVRPEYRPAREKIAAPPDIGLPWVRPLPWPQLPAFAWNVLRDPMASVAKPADAAAQPETGAGPEEEEDPEVTAAREAAEEKARDEKSARERNDNAAKLIQRDGRQLAVRLTPLGADQGQPVWVILEKWPNVRFLVEELNADGRTVRGKYEIGPAEMERYQTVHLEKTLENEYNEERIRRGVKADDRTSNIEFAAWVRDRLAPKWGVPAVRLALRHLAAAKAIQVDTALIAAIGDTCQEAFDLDEEVRAYLDYLQGARANEAAIVVRLGDAYVRAGALPAARAEFEKAAKLGDSEGRVRLAIMLLRLAQTDAELDAANAEFEKCQASTVRGRALAGMAAIRLRKGNVAQAVQLAADARAADAGAFEAALLHGAALYYSGRFAEADQAFAAAATLEKAPEKGGGTRAKSNRAMALLALDKLPEARDAAQACLDADALNFFDPLLVLGEAQQRWGDLERSNDLFQTALQRHPRHAWILLRLATIRLRDGLPKQALAIIQGSDAVPGLLQLVPDSVDALHVAGLTCAAQDPPDWAGAVKYLRRALDKDPKSLDLLYDLARSLQAAGRSDEAIALLERATDPNTGAANTDARVLALLAHAYFDGGRGTDVVFPTIDRAKRARQSTWTKKYVEDLYDAVRKWDQTRIWEDTFNYPARGTLGAGWIEAENLGVVIQPDGERCVFRGKALPAADRKLYSGISRPEALQAFQEMTAVVKADTMFEFVVHLYSGDLPSLDQAGPATPGRRAPQNSAELGFGRDRTGRMMLWVFARGGVMFNVPVKNADGSERMWPDDGAFHRITFRRVGELSKGIFEILLDGEVVPTPAPVEVGQLSAQFNRDATLGIHVDADQGAQVDFHVDSVQVVRILGKR